MSISDVLFGKPLTSDEEGNERIEPLAGVPILGLDALASAAYGPEAALTLLIPLGGIGVARLLPLSLIIVVLLSILYFSYRQTIGEYPNGGGSYTVAKENLGEGAGLLAAVALSIDYVLNVAVGISAGIGAVVSVIPALLPHTLSLCLTLLLLLTIINLRGIRQAGLLFMTPTYLFIACLGIALGIGFVKTIAAGGHPTAVVAPPPLAAHTGALSMWLLIRAFSSGCTAMTGVEAVSNGVPLFRDPAVPRARRTLAILVGVLIALLVSIAFLCRAYEIGASLPGRDGYQSVLSKLVSAIVGRGVFYYVSMSAILAVLTLSANTSFADLPRLCRLLAMDRYLPQSFAHRGRRLVFSHGIVVLALFAALLLTVFGGITDRLIPLFAVGAFLAFTLSQAGMVGHWRKRSGRHAKLSLLINGLGAVCTTVTFVIVLVSKFTEGAWITLLVVPGSLLLLTRIRGHYDALQEESALRAPLEVTELTPPIAVLPVRRWERSVQEGLRFALVLSRDIKVIQVLCGDGDEDDLRPRWTDLVEGPARAAGFAPPTLSVLTSAYRDLMKPLLEAVEAIVRENPRRIVAVIIPELVDRHIRHSMLHGHNGELLTGLLLFKGVPRVVVINVPWRLRE